MSGHQPKRRPPRVVISRQVPASLGEDEGAHHPGGRKGDGEVEDRAHKDDVTVVDINT